MPIKLLLTSFLVLLLVGCATVPLDQLPSLDVGPDFRVLSYNVAFDNVSTASEQVIQQLAGLARVLKGSDADIILLQEVVTVDGWEIARPNRILDFLIDALPDMAMIAPTGAAQMADSNPIFFRRDRFCAIQQGVEWFSDTPWVPDSRTAHTALPRYFVWTLLFDRETNNHLIVANTHFDHRSETVNRRAAEQLREFLARWENLPRLFGGDFNSTPGSAVLNSLESGYRRVLSGNSAPTFEGFPVQIDQIFVSNDISVLYAAVVDVGPNNPSDHRPIIVDVSIEN